MKSTLPMLSKTKILRGTRCLKAMYLTLYHQDLEAPITPSAQALFDQGTDVGIKAREYYPGGVLVDSKPWEISGPSGALTKTKELIVAGVSTLYEAAFEYQGCYARVDIMQYNQSTQSWLLFEVKSSTKAKKEHYMDAAVQAWIMEGSGLSVQQVNILHLNPLCRYPNLENLFKAVDVTAKVRELLSEIHLQIDTIKAAVQSPDIPDIDIGPYCLAPQECGFKEHCWKQKHIPEVSVFNLPNIRQKQWDFYRKGIIALDDMRLSNLDTLQERMVASFKTDERYVHSDLIQQNISLWHFPLVFLDFESINPAIPRYKGCSPYMQVPFQFSAHIWASLEAEVIHKEFLHDTADDPRPRLIESLLDTCGDKGSIVAYYSGFEAQCIEH